MTAEEIRDRELEVELSVTEVADVTEAEFLSAFAEAIRALGYDPLKHGEMRFPTLAEARACLARSPYNRGC